MQTKLKNGAEVVGLLSQYCDLCSYSFGGSMTECKGKYLNGKFYHLKCYAAAVDIYLADKKLEEYANKKV